MFEMKFPFILFLLVLASVNSKNIFYEKLDELLNYCIRHLNELDAGNLLGVAIARNILSKTDSSNRMARELFKKCSELEDKLLENRRKISLELTDQGELNN